MLRSAVLLFAIALPASAAGLFDPATAVSDAELAGMRGGFALPNGVDVALTVQTETAVDGSLVLRSVYRVDTGAPALAVYAPRPGETGPRVTLTMNTAQATAASGPIVTVDRVGGINTVAWSQPVPVSSINVVASVGGTVGAAPEGLSPLPVAAGGPGIATAAGIVTVTELARGVSVNLDGPTLDVTQLFGQAIGAVIANTADNRAIDSATTLDLDVRNTAALTAATAAMRAQDVVQNALAGRAF